MARATVVILLFILAATTVSAAQAPAESPKVSKVTGATEAPEAAKKAKSPEASAAHASRKSGPVAAPPRNSSRTTSSPDSSVSVFAGDLPSPPAPLAAISPIADGPAEDPTDAENSGTAAPRNGFTIAFVAGAVATIIFA